MLRFLKELRYSMGMRKHIFFILMVVMGLISAVYLFRESLQGTLEKAFPTDYGKAEAQEETLYKIDGEYESTATAKDVDIQAELTLNGKLHNAEWMKYEEEFLYNNLYVKNFSEPEKALVGYGTDRQTGSKDIEIERGKYSRVQSVWLAEDVLKAQGFGGAADRMFDGENSYLTEMKIVLGAGFQAYYTAGSKLTLRVENLQFDAMVLGFLEPGATMVVGDEVVCLNYHIVCPLLDLSGLYDPDQEEKYLPSNTDPIYIPDAKLKEGTALRNTDAEKEFIAYDGKKYSPVKCLWIAEEDLGPDIESKPEYEWLKKLLTNKPGDNNKYNFLAGSNFEKEQVFTMGTPTDMMTLYEGQKNLTCYGFLPAGTTYVLNGQEIALDDYMVVLRQKKVKEGNKSKAPANNKDTANTTTGEDGGNEPQTTEPEGKTFGTAERMKLFRILVLKNSGFIKTKKSADEAEIELEKLLTYSWDNYAKDNPSLKRTSNYRIHEADKAGSVVYRDKVRDIPGKLRKIDTPGYFLCIILLTLYFLYKFFKGSEYFTALVMTGDSKVEIGLLFVVEAAILYFAACGLGFALAFVVGKLLSLGSTSAAPIFSKNFRIVLFPLIAVGVVIAIRDFGKLFRKR